MRGRLLVATPAIVSGLFARSVVLLLDHDADGALGVIVNRPLSAPVDEVLPPWGEVVHAPPFLFEGGPVATDSALAVGVLRDGFAPIVGWQPMIGRFGLVDLEQPPPSGDELTGVRVFAGYAGWGAGQLEDELAEGSWLVVDADVSDLLTSHPDTLWREVLRRQDGDLRMWASFPDDPTLN